MITIRDYTESDAPEVGRLISDTYSEFNLFFATPEERDLMLGPFRHARSTDAAHQQAIVDILQSPIFLVAEEQGQIAGVLRGREERLASLFVGKDYQHQGIGRRLVETFEAKMNAQGVSVIRVAATEYAVLFYTRLGYKKSTGLRSSWSFDGYGLPIQPMKKILTSG
jgi:predicted N-acetyltransferase YhbS